MSAICRYEGCAIAETGSCALENDPNTCPHRTLGGAVGEADVVSKEATGPAVGAPVLSAPEETPSFPTSTTLEPPVIGNMMGERYVTLVGVLGDPESGKTACLVSLYLQISHAKLKGWSFADSRSLMAFEEIARGARRWNEGKPPEQMTVHTEMADDRLPGFLHLRLRQDLDDRCFDLALPDLPGEWTKALIRSAQSERFEFLRSADVIWLVVDGRSLMNVEQRQGAITRLGQLAGRLQSLIGDAMPRVLLVTTHHDLANVSSKVLDRVSTELAKHGVLAQVISVASFSDDKDVENGFGLAELINATVAERKAAIEFWPSAPFRSEQQRAFLSYRREK